MPEAVASGEEFQQKKYCVQSGKDELARFFHDPNWDLSLLYSVAASFLLPADCTKIQKMVDDQWNKPDTEDIGIRVQALNDPAFRITIEREVKFGHCVKISSLDQFTQVANESIYNDDPRQPLDYDDLSDRFFLKPFAPGTFHEVIGPVTIEGQKRGEKGKRALGVGKTATEGNMIQLQAKNGWNVIPNYTIKGVIPENITPMYDLKQIFIRCIENFRQGKKTMIVIDEIAQTVPHMRGTSTNTLILSQIAFLLRKVGAALTVISQRENDIPSSIHSMVESQIMKLSQTTMTFRYGESKNYLIKNVPMTTLAYDTTAIGSILIQFDLEGMHAELQEAMSKNDPDIDQFQIILDYLNADKMEITEKMLKNYAVVAAKANGKQRDIAKVISTFRPCSQSTVCRWLNEAGITTGDD